MLTFPPVDAHDVLPDAFARRRAAAQTLWQHLENAGYAGVATPMVEYEWVLDRRGDRRSGSPLRLIEPDTGQVLVMRADLTPQLARMAAGPLASSPRPLRLAYEASLFRRSNERSRQATQSLQLGFELFGSPAPAGESELLSLVRGGAAALGLDGAVIELSCPAWLRSLLTTFETPESRQRAAAAFSDRDPTLLAQLAGDTQGLRELCDCVLPLRDAATWAVERAKTPEAREIASQLTVLAQQAQLVDLPVDFGEAHGLEVYSGLGVNLYAPGSHQVLGRGGRYDHYMAELGRPETALGFAFYLDRIAQREAPSPETGQPSDA